MGEAGEAYFMAGRGTPANVSWRIAAPVDSDLPALASAWSQKHARPRQRADGRIARSGASFAARSERRISPIRKPMRRPAEAELTRIKSRK